MQRRKSGQPHRGWKDAARYSRRTQTDRDDDLKIGRELERKDAEIDRLRAALADMTKRVELSWERRDFAPDSDLEAVETAKKFLNIGSAGERT